MKIAYGNLEFIDPNLREMMADVEALIEEVTGKEAVITSLYRIGDGGVHGQLPLRGCDLRLRDSNHGEIATNRINAMWRYDRSREWLVCAIFHDVGRGAHLHIQVHPNTERITDP